MSKSKQITPREALKLLLDNEDFPEVRGGVYPSPFDMANGSYLLVGVDLSQEFPFIVIFQKGEGGMRMKNCWITEQHLIKKKRYEIRTRKLSRYI